MTLEITPSGQACGATIRGLDLSSPLDGALIRDLRGASAEHHVLAFPDQAMSDDDLERFTLSFGDFGQDPFIEPIEGREHVIAVHRGADETAPVFATSWHSDWSFQEIPPAATCLFGRVIPPAGGDTLFANQHLAAETLPDDLRRRLDGLMAVHSAGAAYGRGGVYGTAEEEAGVERAMKIVTSDEADATGTHPVICRHPDNGRPAFLGCLGYIQCFEGLDAAESWDLLREMHRWQTQEHFQYRHVWEANMLVMWDNRSVLHSATTGFDGYERLLHRTTLAGTDVPVAAA
ncbi:MAG: TauD/TfdA family dioxygenase [Acidimicrobiia bacterium]|nr:TauD/TfdA family dioxygenase [Acidimicrobiia bacterium]